jgi:hypothetical protein
MVDISSPSENAITIGVAIAAALLTWFGRKTGEVVKDIRPIEPTTSGIAAGFVDVNKMERLVQATESIAKTLKLIWDVQTDEHERSVEAQLEEIKKLVQGRENENVASRAEAKVLRNNQRPRRTGD